MKAQLVEVAARILDAEGSAALTMRHLADVAGTTTTPVYSRFGSKNGILDHLYINGFRQLVTRLASVADSPDPLGDILSAGREYLAFAVENPALYDLMFEGRGSDHRPSPAAYAEALTALDELARRVDRAISAGTMPSRSTIDAATMIWAASHGAITLSARNPLPSLAARDEFFVATLTALVRGMCDTRPDGS